ncbi:MAG: TetR/AcrR family transcriptional regulator [Treponema sp.]|nr:TetR/AcrR family transcriptional regulator [Treponema sp.]
MAIIVEHDKRRKQILDNALIVFMDEGFVNATFQKIADQCGIARTILYLYFKNKKEIFNYSIKQLLLNVEENINSVRSDKSLNSEEKITKVLLTIFKLLEQNRQLLSVVLDYLVHLSKEGVSPEDRVRRRTVKLRHILSSMFIEGVKNGELKKMKVKAADDYLYSFIEAAIFQLVVTKRKNLSELRETAIFAIKQLSL